MIIHQPFPSPSTDTQQAALSHQGQLTKPAGSLGRLEEIAIQLATWFDDPFPKCRPAAALIFAADHGVSQLGVSAFPREVTRAMLFNFLRGGAAASVLARYHSIPLTVVDVGVAGGRLAWHGPGYLRAAVADAPCGDLVNTDAMDAGTLQAALEAGATAVKALANDVRVIVLGDMGIGNTTVASALSAGLLGGTADDWVGRGTGVDDATLQKKRDVVTAALARVGTAQPRELLQRLGGREIAAIAGAMIEAARTRRVVLVDGFIVTAAALAATRLEPRVLPALLFAHRSAEAAHDRMLLALSARPLLDLQMRLGEGTGALIALALLEMACCLHREMATFAAAGVPEKVS